MSNPSTTARASISGIRKVSCNCANLTRNSMVTGHWRLSSLCNIVEKRETEDEDVVWFTCGLLE